MNMAMGMVAAMVKVPQGLPFSAFTTTRLMTPSRITMMSRTVMSAVPPPMGPISSRAIWPRLLPLRRTLANRMTKSCTAPPSTTPMMIQSVPGR